jgi:signal transduction histidine kinase
MTAVFDNHLGKLHRGDKAASIYNSNTDDLYVLARFLRDGIRSGEKCVCLADEPPIEGLIDALTSLNVDTSESIRSGDLEFVSASTVVATYGELTPESILHYIELADKEAIEGGKAGLRLACQMNWILSHSRSDEIVLEFGRLLNIFLCRSRSIVLCRYRQTDFDQALLCDVLRSNPLVYLNAMPCSNPYFEPPELWMLPGAEASQSVKGARAKCWIDRLNETQIDESNRLSLQDQLQQAQRMGSLENLASRIGHEINNHLSIVIGYSDLLLLQQRDVGHSTDMLREIRDAGRASALLTKQLLEFGRKQPGAFEHGGENND